MSSIIDDYVTVPRSMVKDSKEIKGASETDKKKTPQVSPSMNVPVSECSSSSLMSSAASNSIPSRSDVKEMKVSNIELNAALGKVMNLSTKMSMKRGKGVKGVTSGDNVVATTLSYFLDYTIPNGALNYSLACFTDLCSEWPAFAQLYEQYRVLRIDLETWTGNIMFYGAGSVQMWPIASLFTRTPYTTTLSMAQICDHPETKILDYGYFKNLHKQSLKPSGAFVNDPVTGWQHTPGWLATSSANTHAWGLILQQTTGALVGALGSTRPLTHRLKYVVEFRRRREITA